jgi:uncharacterized protein
MTGVAVTNKNQSPESMKIAVIGSGISGLSAAWLLAKKHDVTLFEAADRFGGHSNTVSLNLGTRQIDVDCGFIVYNEATYPNLMALFAEIDVETVATDMSFAVSLDNGRYEYAGTDLRGLFAQPVNMLRPRFWSMLLDLLRFYRNATRDIVDSRGLSLEAFLQKGRYGAAFRDDHLYPMAGAIWSASVSEIGKQPAESFVRFCDNHGLLKLTDRPLWRTVKGASRQYVEKIIASLGGKAHCSCPIRSIRRDADGVTIFDDQGIARRFDHVVLATHADQSLRLIEHPSSDEKTILGAFRYEQNEAIIHTDASLMPKRRAAWASWNYLSDGTDAARSLSVTYWMNRLQPLGDAPDVFVTLNPLRAPREGTVLHRETYTHPQFDLAALAAQKQLWSLQEKHRTWFCGAYFGAGFHEDGLQAGLSVAEHLGSVRRPWDVKGESDRIYLQRAADALPEEVYHVEAAE